MVSSLLKAALSQSLRLWGEEIKAPAVPILPTATVDCTHTSCTRFGLLVLGGASGTHTKMPPLANCICFFQFFFFRNEHGLHSACTCVGIFGLEEREKKQRKETRCNRSVLGIKLLPQKIEFQVPALTFAQTHKHTLTPTEFAALSLVYSALSNSHTCRWGDTKSGERGENVRESATQTVGPT